MEAGRPEYIAINHDDYSAKHIGKTGDGHQFFLTTPFVPASRSDTGCEYIALYLFTRNGIFEHAEIDRLGPRGTFSEDDAASLYKSRLRRLGNVRFCRIVVKPFEIEFDGNAFGLIVSAPEDEDEVWAVEAQPGNYMAFFAPWDAGDYDT